jgi:anaerobic ribonucleoside-triphosphate reductase activating protein
LWSFDPRFARGVKGVADEVCDFFKGSTPADGVTISGGEPFDQPEPLMALLRLLRTGGVRDVLLYTGYEISSILSRNKELPKLATAVIDGSFKLGLETEAAWKGSSNQTLTLFDPNYEERYTGWSRMKKGAMQVECSRDGVVYIGIPRQSDVSLIRERIALKIEEGAEFQ